MSMGHHVGAENKNTGWPGIDPNWPEPPQLTHSPKSCSGVQMLTQPAVLSRVLGGVPFYRLLRELKSFRISQGHTGGGGIGWVWSQHIELSQACRMFLTQFTFTHDLAGEGCQWTLCLRQVVVNGECRTQAWKEIIISWPSSAGSKKRTMNERGHLAACRDSLCWPGLLVPVLTLGKLPL